MSQAKVDRYKEEKANRQEIMQKEKRNRMLWKVGGGLVAIVAIGWIGFSAYGVATGSVENPGVQTTELNVDALNDYLDTISPEEE